MPQRWLLSRQFSLTGLDEGSLTPLVQPSFSSERADFAGLREFHPGDHPRQIHWHASGRVPGQILARQFEPPRDHQVFVFLDSFYRSDEAYRRAAAFENNICLALALAERLVASQFAVTVVTWAGGCRRFTLNSSASELHDLRRWLATLEPTHDHALPELLSAARLPSNASVMVLALSRDAALRAAEKSRWLVFTPDQLKPFAVRVAVDQRPTPATAPIV